MDVVTAAAGAEIALSSLAKLLRSAEDASSMSLSQYTKKCVVNSKVYIQKEIAQEEIVGNLLSTLHNVYIGYILTALQMNTYVQGNKTVRDLMSVVATEDFEGDDYIKITNIGDDFGKTFNTVTLTEKDGTTLVSPRNTGRSNKVSQQSARVQTSDDTPFPSGKIVEVTFNTVNNRGEVGGKIAVNMFVQLLPRIIPYEVAEQFVSLSFTPGIEQRWLQYKVGEISFWEDFVLNLDILKKRRKALQSDNNEDLLAILQSQQNALSRQLMKLGRVNPEMQNIANSIVLFDKRSFDKFTKDSNLNFKRFGDRQRFFGKCFCMMLATIDTQYNTVELYINGLDAKCEYAFSQLIKTSKKQDMNLVNLMNQMSQGRAPRF